MFFKRDKKIGQDLALIAIMLPEQQGKKISLKQFSEVEILRFKFCLSIINLATIMWWINFLERNTKRAKKIVDNMLKSFMDVYENKPDVIRMGDFVIDTTELKLIDYAMGQIEIDENTKTNYRTLMPKIYNIRIKQYSDALLELSQMMFKKEESPGLFVDPVTRLLIEHFTGEEWGKYFKNNFDFVVELASFYKGYYIAIADMVKDKL
ncbi:MAG: hypothetical protein COS40_10135 [Deltaproteobacteria bacterium CG03_land_8_20_14_0_80_45_14]|nr:MAG: hypothetical protein COS40_10135 [Deltaproteobacteria bacterium CG03_land_8_20_14_0_80_45_14]